MLHLLWNILLRNKWSSPYKKASKYPKNIPELQCLQEPSIWFFMTAMQLVKFFKEELYLESLKEFWWNLVTEQLLKNWFENLWWGTKGLSNKDASLTQNETQYRFCSNICLLPPIMRSHRGNTGSISSGGSSSIPASLFFYKIQLCLF